MVSGDRGRPAGGAVFDVGAENAGLELNRTMHILHEPQSNRF